MRFARRIVDARDLLGMMCGMRYWKKSRLTEADIKAIAQAAQVIVDEFAEHYACTLEGKPGAFLEGVRADEREKIKQWFEDHGHALPGWGYLQEAIDEYAAASPPKPQETT